MTSEVAAATRCHGRGCGQVRLLRSLSGKVGVVFRWASSRPSRPALQIWNIFVPQISLPELVFLKEPCRTSLGQIMICPGSFECLRLSDSRGRLDAQQKRPGPKISERRFSLLIVALHCTMAWSATIGRVVSSAGNVLKVFQTFKFPDSKTWSEALSLSLTWKSSLRNIDSQPVQIFPANNPVTEVRFLWWKNLVQMSIFSRCTKMFLFAIGHHWQFGKRLMFRHQASGSRLVPSLASWDVYM